MECISKVAPNFSSLYNNFKEDQGIYELDFKTIESKDLLGELKDSRDYDGKTIYLNKDLFKSNFGKSPIVSKIPTDQDHTLWQIPVLFYHIFGEIFSIDCKCNL